ncbi:hypothetical protein CLUG_02267 [Clavispora lusitaniae ATCC 42720]|uniref:CNH domain-containing protein n=1 Tax=Clavispora lusitaniae (strain ATCC 42720) TaxID=306902 RepID=C4Y235_CLAL4|nr:uncharacterized protein CLUG_02267 [Clavispora lusitaniae ATCC 42720]EEQ38144.1 hypothetical protein CLUG_02267 [Clavispora lusitaniae ATCC 42720]
MCAQFSSFALSVLNLAPVHSCARTSYQRTDHFMSENPDAPQINLPNGYLISRLSPDLELDPSESVCCVSAFESNLYVGTSHGNLLHYFLFEDADQHMLLSKLPVNAEEQKPVEKLLLLPDIQLCLALANRVIHAFSLPELSPCHIGKVKDVNEMSRLTQVDNPKVKNKYDKIIAYTPSKIRVVQFLPDKVKLLRDINYSGAVMGFSSAAGTSANYSNICLAANEKNYDVVDLQQTRRISLFDYNPENIQNIKPHIVPFEAKDKPKIEEEYLLAIASDASTSMAMFINAFGDVTRGTLTWVGEGNPTNGLAIEWPYVIGLFSGADGDKLKLNFSSLKTLEVVFSEFLDLESFFGLAHNETLHLAELEYVLDVVNREVSGLLSLNSPSDNHVIQDKKYYSSSRSIFFSEKSVFYLHQLDSFLPLYEKVMRTVEEAESAEDMNDLLNEVESFSHYKDVSQKTYTLLLLTTGKIEELKEYISGMKNNETDFDIRILLLVYPEFPDDDESWESFKIEKAILEITNKLGKFSLEDDFKTWLIDTAYSNKEMSQNWQYFRFLKYKGCAKDSEVASLIDSEKSEWAGDNNENEKLITYYKKENRLLSLLHLYRAEQEAGIKANERAREIIDVILHLLAEEDLATKLDENNQSESELIRLAFFQLRNNITDSDEYTKKLLELLKLRPDEGLELLKENKGGSHESTHHFILKELSKTHTLDHKFSYLKIEYIEQSFLECITEKSEIDYEILDELLHELLNYIATRVDSFQQELEDLKMTISQFKRDVNLSDSEWPKLSLMEYFHIHSGKGDSNELSKVYLKVYELLVVKRLHKSPLPSLDMLDDEVFSYLKRSFGSESSEDLISYLLEEHHDCSTAEWFCIYNIMPLPRKLIYTEQIREDLIRQYHKLDTQQVRENLNTIFQYYLHVEDFAARSSLLAHMVNRFGYEYFTMEEVLQILPEDLPLSYVRQYLARHVVATEKQKNHFSMVKILTKSEAKFTHEVCQDFEKTYNAFVDGNGHSN